MAEAGGVEEVIKRIGSHKGIQGITIASADGIPIKTTLDNATATQYAALATHLSAKARAAVGKLRHPGGGAGGGNELELIRIRSNKHEIIIAPEFDKGHEFQLIVVQNPNMAP